MILTTILLASMTTADIRMIDRRVQEYQQRQSLALAPFPAYWTPLGKPKDSPEAKGMKIRWDGERFSMRESGHVLWPVLALVAGGFWVGVYFLGGWSLVLDVVLGTVFVGTLLHIWTTFWRGKK
jgi:hypothetical protein